MYIHKPFFIKASLILIFSLGSLFATAQNIFGLWEITEVKMGNEAMTPIAKWTRINLDGTYESGNGWLQNSEGVWSYNENTNSYAPKEKNGITDPFGGFTVTLSENTMLWERMEEEGAMVTVSLQRIDKLPKAPADMVVGLWELQANQPTDEAHTIHIRWDRLYKKQIGSVTEYGYWNIHAHRVEIVFFDDSTENLKKWKIEVDDNTLKLIGISDSNKGIEHTYKRLHKFPE